VDGEICGVLTHTLPIGGTFLNPSVDLSRVEILIQIGGILVEEI
jgi:hypothetical protein